MFKSRVYRLNSARDLPSVFVMSTCGIEVKVATNIQNLNCIVFQLHDLIFFFELTTDFSMTRFFLTVHKC